MASTPDRRSVVGGLGAWASGLALPDYPKAQAMNAAADLILFNGKITTLNRQQPEASAVAIRDGRSLAVGAEQEVMQLAGPETRRDRPGRAARHPRADRQPHAHHPRRPQLQHGAALGRRALARRRHAMLKEQVDRTPAPQWVRVVGGFTEHQFAEKRLPTLEEINAVAPDTPVFILHLYDRALLNARRAARGRLHQGHAEPARRRDPARCARQSHRACCIARPNATILYATLAKGPEAAARIPEQLYAPLHARDEPARRDRRDRCRRRIPELSGRLRDHRGAARATGS